MPRQMLYYTRMEAGGIDELGVSFTYCTRRRDTDRTSSLEAKLGSTLNVVVVVQQSFSNGQIMGRKVER